jgi:hypothetical protein
VDGQWVAAEGERPQPGSGHDLYARAQCPALGWLVTGATLYYAGAFVCAPRAGGRKLPVCACLDTDDDGSIDEARPTPRPLQRACTPPVPPPVILVCPALPSAGGPGAAGEGRT